MQGRWDNAPPKLKEYLDEFEAFVLYGLHINKWETDTHLPFRILYEVAKIVTKFAKSSRARALINAGDRDAAITRLEKRLGDVQMSIIVSPS